MNAFMKRVLVNIGTVVVSLLLITGFVYAANAGIFLTSQPVVSHRLSEVYGDRLQSLNIEAISIRRSWDNSMATEHRYSFRNADGNIVDRKFVMGGLMTYKFRINREGEHFVVRTDLPSDTDTAIENTLRTILAHASMVAGQVEKPGSSLVMDFQVYSKSKIYSD